MMDAAIRRPVTRWWISRQWDRVVLFLMSRLFTFAIALAMGWSTRQRMSHNNGIVARGTFTANPDPAVPPHAMFAPGKSYPCRIRHAAATFYDDAMSTIRSISVKFADSRWESPFDLELNTGSITLFWNAVSFLKLASLRKERYGVEYGEYYKLYPVAKEGARRTLRRDPTSFTNLVYYNKTPLLYVADDGTRYYAKYRVVPFAEDEETGKVAKHSPQWVEPENQRIDPTITPRSRNYLKEEFAHRVLHQAAIEEPVKYRLQVQLRKHHDDQDPRIFNCCIDWPMPGEQEEFPWHELGVFEITEPLNWEESLKTTFSFKNMPKSLGVIPARSIFDYNSLNYMRKNIDFAKRVRLFAYKVKGLPPEIPDDDWRNASWFIDQSRAT
jgi:catalase